MESLPLHRSMNRVTVVILIFVALVIAVSYATHSGALKNEFTNYDDDLYIYQNYRIKNLSLENITWLFSHGYFHSYIPLTMLSHAVDYALWGMNPSGHHFTSVILHTVNAAWVFIIGLLLFAEVLTRDRVSGDKRPTISTGIIIGSAIGALLFSLHPLRTESVGWVSDRKDLLCAFFVLPSLAAYFIYATGRGRKGWYWISLVLLLAGVMSKSIAVVTPVVMVLADLLLLRKVSWQRALQEKIPMFLVCFAGGLAATLSASSPGVHAFVGDASSVQRALFPFYAFSFYLQKTLWPVGLVPLYPLPDSGTMIFVGSLTLVVIASCVVAFKKRAFWWVFLWGAYGVFLAPTIFGLNAGIQPLADRYTYLPSVPLSLFGGGVVAFLLEKSGWKDRASARAGILSISAGVLIVIGAAGIRQMAFWQTSESLWRRQVSIQPDGFALNNLGQALLKKNDMDGAIVAFTEAVKMRPGYARAYNNLGSTYYMTGGKNEEAKEALARALQLDPEYIESYVNLANVFAREGRADDAMKILDKALQRNPRSAEAMFAKGSLAEAGGDTLGAMAIFQQAISSGSDYEPPYVALSNIHILRGEYNEAIHLYQETIHLNPLNPDAHYNLGIAYYRIGDEGKAIASFAQALAVDPGYAQAYFNLGVIYGHQRNDEMSLAAFRRAAQLGDTDAQKVLSERGYEW